MSVVFFAVIAIKKPYAGSFMLSLMAKSLLINANRLILYNMKGKQMRHYYSHAARLTCHFYCFWWDASFSQCVFHPEQTCTRKPMTHQLISILKVYVPYQFNRISKTICENSAYFNHWPLPKWGKWNLTEWYSTGFPEQPPKQKNVCFPIDILFKGVCKA